MSLAACSSSCSTLQLTARRFYDKGGSNQPSPMLEAAVEDTSGHPVAGVVVEFFIETDDIGTSTTGPDGVARHVVELTQTISGIDVLSHWSAQINEPSCTTSNTAQYTNVP